MLSKAPPGRSGYPVLQAQPSVPLACIKIDPKPRGRRSKNGSHYLINLDTAKHIHRGGLRSLEQHKVRNWRRLEPGPLFNNLKDSESSQRRQSITFRMANPRVGVGVFVFRETGEFVIGERIGSHGASKFTLYY